LTKYKVTGVAPVFKTRPGEFFEADLDPVQEQRLIDCGAIQPVKKKKTASSDTSTKEEHVDG
jgi:hypothetical protein